MSVGVQSYLVIFAQFIDNVLSSPFDQSLRHKSYDLVRTLYAVFSEKLSDF